MTIKVTAPNGASVQFPDGTDHDTINKVMGQLAGGAVAQGPQPDKYQQAAIDEQAALKAAGGNEGAGFTRRLAHGATLGADTTLLAGLETPLEMVKRGTFNPAEGYNYAKAREDQIMADARKNTGMLGEVPELLGGGVAGVGLANAGVTAARFLAPEAGLIKRAVASAADGLGIGGVVGASEGNGLAERATNAAMGAGAGALFGAGAPFAFAGLKAAAAPIIANVKARFNPQGYAEGQVARGIQESGLTPNQISLDTIQAANEGQGAYTLADAMGNSGQRMLSTVARAPGEGRTAVVNALDARQADQGRRVAGTLAEGFEAPQTAAQARDTMTTARNTAADAEYGAVRADAQPVDMAGTLNHIDQIIGTQPGRIPTPPSGQAPAAQVMAQPNAPAAAAPKAQSLLEFIASKGGLGPDAELAAIGGEGHTVNVEGVGRRKLVRQGGWPLDYAREAAEEAGYLRGNHTGTSTVNDLLDAIDAEMRGQKRFPEGFEGHAGKRETVARSEREQHELDRHMQGFESDLAAAGHGELGPDVKARAVRAMADSGMDADTAVEHAFRQLEQEDAAGVARGSGFPGDRIEQPKNPAGTEKYGDARPAIPQPNDSIEAIFGLYRQRLARVNPNDFAAVQRIRGEMADAAQNARQNGYGNRARLIGGAVRQLDTAMENASEGHLAANRNFAQASRNIDAIDRGRTAALRGRTEDTIPAYQALAPEGQAAFRTGYVDPLIEQAQGGAFGVNKARPLTSDAFQGEAAAMAPNNAMMQRRLAREQTMFETRAQATGGSKTVDNLNDHAAMSVDPHFVGQILTGNLHGALRTALHAGSNALTGNTAAVRQEVAKILLQRGPNMNPATLENMVNQVVARMRHVQNIVQSLGRGVKSGVAATAAERLSQPLN